MLEKRPKIILVTKPPPLHTHSPHRPAPAAPNCQHVECAAGQPGQDESAALANKKEAGEVEL